MSLNNSTALKPCPFCNEVAFISTETDYAEGQPSGSFVFVECHNCHATSSKKYASYGGECHMFYEEVRSEWNQRAAPEIASKTQLQAIQDATNKILCEAFQEKGINGVNWGELDCVDVCECHSVYGCEPTILVCIEECSPESNLRAFVYDRLNKQFPNHCFDVRLEW